MQAEVSLARSKGTTATPPTGSLNIDTSLEPPMTKYKDRAGVSVLHAKTCLQQKNSVSLTAISPNMCRTNSIISEACSLPIRTHIIRPHSGIVYSKWALHCSALYCTGVQAQRAFPDKLTPLLSLVTQGWFYQRKLIQWLSSEKLRPALSYTNRIGVSGSPSR